MNPWGLFFIAAGLFSAAGGMFDWEWFMNHRKAQFMSTILSRTGARIFYVIVGAALAILGTMMAAGLVRDSG